MIKGIVFDKDGTLLEYEKFWIPVAEAAVEKLIKEHNISRKAVDKMLDNVGADRGISGVLCYGTYGGIAKAFNKAIEEVCEIVNALSAEEVSSAFEESLHSGVLEPTCENIRDVLERLKTKGCVIALVTSDNKIVTENCLNELGILDCFDAIYADDGIHPPKPDPYYMECFCREFSFKPTEVAMVGDTLTDMLFAENSGAMAIGVAKRNDDREVLLTKTDKVLYDISYVEDTINNM